MNNPGTVLIKVVVFAGGGVLGALLARWVDEALSKRAQEKSEYDKSRYAQGLTPVAPQPAKEENQ